MFMSPRLLRLAESPLATTTDAVSMEHQPVAGQQRRHIVLVHGACHGGWSWYKVAARLQQRYGGGGDAAAVGRRCCCYRVAAPDLAASGVDGRGLRDVPTFRDYTEPLLGVLRSLPAGERAVLVGHSLGGLNVALAAELLPEKVAAAVVLSAFMPDCSSPPSHVLQQLDKHGNVPRLDNELKPQDADGNLPASFMFGPNFTEQNLYQLCSPEDITLGKSLMRVASLFVEDLQRQQPFSMGRYGSVRKVYVVCKQDTAIPEEFQRWMAAAGRWWRR